MNRFPMKGPARVVMALAVFGSLAIPVAGQWMTQEIPLSPGWNGVQVLVQPAQSECAVVFSNTPVEKLFWWRRTGTGMEFDLDPRDPFPRAADWNYWFATNPAISTFGSLLAGESYAIRVASNAAPFSLRVIGKPVLTATRWIPGEKNLIGLPVSTNKQVSFAEFFSFSTDFTMSSATGTIYRIAGPSDIPERVWNPALELIRGGEAYWITAGPGARDYGGPIRVTTETGLRLLDFGGSVSPHTLLIRNLTDTDRNIRIEHLSSASPPALAGVPGLLGKTPLLYKRAGFDEAYQSLPDVLVTNLARLGRLALSLAPDPQGLSGGVAGSAWQSILRVTDGDNVRFANPVVDVRLGVSCDGSLSGQLDPAGLWVGSVSVTKVERAPTRLGSENAWKDDGPVPVSRPFAFRLILHVDALGAPRLLQRALVACRPAEGAEANASTLSTNLVTAILADEAAAETYATQHPDARIVRISSTCFPLMAPVGMAGVFGGTNTLSCIVELPYDDPVNPFVHRYHPQHDNLRYDNGVATNEAEGVESYTVTRAMGFSFSPLDPDRGIENRQWGVTEAGGAFEETVEGLNKTIRVKGTFRVERVSRVDTLLD